MSDITILIPTLNEEPNIDKLLEKILSVRDDFHLEFDILFVDSASTDDTCRKVKSWTDKAPVQLLRREVNLGLAGAVIAGARHLESRYVLVMDADLSHPPEAIPVILDSLVTGGHDMVIGSRYVNGGSTPDWPTSRKLCSRLATMPALLFCRVKDPLAGFFAVKREYLANLQKNVRGFKIGLAVMAEYGQDFRVAEIPIEFRDRDYGESKMGKRVIFEYLLQLLSMTMNRLRPHR